MLEICLQREDIAEKLDMQHNNREAREIERKKLASISTGFAV